MAVRWDATHASAYMIQRNGAERVARVYEAAAIIQHHVQMHVAARRLNELAREAERKIRRLLRSLQRGSRLSI